MQRHSVHPILQDVPKQRVLFFTGHRPEKLPRGERLAQLTAMLHEHIDIAVLLGYTHFYTGLADGIDYFAAEYLFQLRQRDSAVTVIGVQPCQDYREFFRRRGYSMPRLEYMLANVDALVTLPGSYRDARVFLHRNSYMADRSAAVIAVCGDGRSGSMHAFRYAQRRHLSYCRICLERERAEGGWETERCGL